MPLYDVSVRQYRHLDIFIEATSEDQAKHLAAALALSMDDWQVDDIEMAITTLCVVPDGVQYWRDGEWVSHHCI